MNLTPQMLIEQTQNFYGLKVDIQVAIEFLNQVVGATPGSFYEWVSKRQSSGIW